MVISTVRFELSEPPLQEELSELTSRFESFMRQKIPNLLPQSEDKIFMVRAVNRSEHLIGGVLANCYWNGLEIDTLWVEDSERGKGLGSSLLSQAESFGIENGAVVSFLKTVEAKGFYEKLGYEVYGVLEDRPIGTVIYHMKKRLRQKP
ncbi:GNAT family N-acetyltransferase [Leptolyngbya sp. FACHB-541]|uniref:GNAT family N-acetyltransferase n=1 Tax=Leptolyngbya sp. FACHB-541 TaxID=2692810 RepID=UPI0016842B1A|nr:GNAT family N-acetyltransferase [Leptolyngbya sp. FACHB-541]MBD1995684.1 GNAT family N-acetyltransferase [Leptolyngbya sp. FACHB-541]